MKTERCTPSAGGVIRISGVVLWILLALGCAGLSYKPLMGGAKAPEPIPPGTASARFQAMVFEAKIPSNRLADFDAPAIGSKTGTAADFEDALGRFGETKALYRVDQTVSLEKEAKIVIGNQVPAVTSRRLTPNGKSVSAVQYQNVGVSFRLSEPSERAGGGSTHELNVELAVLGDTAVPIAEGVTAPRSHEIEMSSSGVGDFWKPYIMAVIDSTADKDATSVAYICRVVLSPVQ